LKKLFISCPMKNRSKESIQESFETMHKVAEIMFGEELEVIQSYIDEDPPNDVNAGIWYLAHSMLKLSEADYFIGVYNQRLSIHENYNMCDFEERIARNYNIPTKTINCIDYKCFYDLYKKKTN